MKTRFGDVLFWTGLAGAAICILYAVDTIWIRESGRSLLGISGLFESFDDTFAAVAIGVVLAALFCGAGVAARSFVNKSAELRAAEMDPAEIEDAPPGSGAASSQAADQAPSDGDAVD